MSGSVFWGSPPFKKGIGVLRYFMRFVEAVSIFGCVSASVVGAMIQVPGDQGTIQLGIDAAVSGVDEVVVGPGTYNERIDLDGKAITLRSSGGAGVTTIDGGAGGSVVTCSSGETGATVLEGFTITNGSASFGGGMRNNGSSPTVRNCRFIGNVATIVGGGMDNNGGHPTVTNCAFIGNTADNGGGMDNNGGHPTVTNCAFIGNTATSAGGGGMFNDDSSPTVTNCTFSGNMATGESGGGMYNIAGSSPTLTNCTFSENTAGFVGGGMANEDAGTNPTMINCIFWGNSDAGGMDESGQINVFGGTPVVNFSDVQGGWTGAGGNNLNVDPMFLDDDGADGTIGTADDDVRLGVGSLCIDAGDNGVVTEATDLDGVARVRNCVVDMGAYESTPIAVTVIMDADCDLDVDGVDFAVFAQCFNKAGNPPRTLGCPGWVGYQLDGDDDGDVDGVDFATFAQCFNKAGNPPRTLGCPEN
jgi:hypothetical protein